MRKLLLTAVAIASLALPAGAGATHLPIHWESVLPDSPPSGPQPGPVPHCRKATIRCIDVQIRRMRTLRNRLGCDHRAVFTTTYLTLTQELRAEAARRPSKFTGLRYLYREVATFANHYFRSITRDAAGKTVPPAWRVAFETARSGEVFAGQDMMLGINAHVQSDMPFVMARLGLVDRAGRSRKPDHDVTNEVLAAAYQRVIDRVANRYDPMLRTTNPSWTPAEDVAALEVVRGWRENVWRNAEKLIAAKDAAERRRVGAQIKREAAVWARSLAAPQEPGYRATRDAYCARALGR